MREKLSNAMAPLVLSAKTKKPILHIIGSDVVILNNRGICIASSNPTRVGRLVRLPDKTKLEVIPINNNGSLEAYLVLNKNEHKLEELELIKGLAALTLQQFQKAVGTSLNSTDQFITGLVGGYVDPKYYYRYEREAKILGLNVNVRRSAIIIKVDKFSEKNLYNLSKSDFQREEIIQNYKNKIEQALSGFFTQGHDVVCVYIGDDKFVAFKKVKKREEAYFIKNMKNGFNSIFGPLLTFENDTIKIGFSNSHHGIEGLIKSFKEAEIALETGERYLKGRNQIYYFGDLGILRILMEDDARRKVQFAREILAPIMNSELSETLEVFLDNNLNVKKTARQMKIHPNTVIYRMTKINELVGLDPRIFKHAFSFLTALLIERFIPEYQPKY